jgi:hypothetical protein
VYHPNFLLRIQSVVSLFALSIWLGIGPWGVKGCNEKRRKKMNTRFFALLATLVMVTMVTVPGYVEAEERSGLDTNHIPFSFESTFFGGQEGLGHTYAMTGESIMAGTAGGAITSTDTIAEEKAEEMTREEVAEMLANPFSYLWFGMIQNDTYWYDGDLLDLLDEDKKVMNTTMIQPVMSTQFTENWRLIFRPVIPVHSFDTISGFDIIENELEGPIIESDWDRETGLGDIVLWTALSPQYTPPFVYGFGPTIMMDTASDEWLGTGKWSAGPMATACYISDKWIVGGVAQHWWSFTGDSDRDSVNLTDFQPIIRYRLSKTTNIGIAPNIKYNWNGESDNKLQLPIGGGISTVIMLGRLPVGIGAEAYYYAESPDIAGPEYQFRFFFSPVLPAPAWSRVPIFGD